MDTSSEPLPGMPATTALSDLPPHRRAVVARRFANKVVAVDTGCEIFTGGISSPDGYGRVSVTIKSVERIFRAHRLACLLAGIDLTHGSVVEHGIDACLGDSK